MVGHTHEDIDQRFSMISKELHKQNAYTLPEMTDIMRIKLHQDVEVEVLGPGSVFDIKKWMEPVLNGIHNHTYPHIYRYYKYIHFI